MADIFCPDDIVVDATPGACGAIVHFEDATTPDIPQAQEVIMLFEGAAEDDSPYIENGMRLDGNGLSHIDAPWPIPCNNRQGAAIHPNTSNTWTYNDGQPFTPTRLFVCSTNMRFTTGDCGTEFIPATTGEVTFPDTPEWQNITSMVWEQWGDDFDASMDNFRFIPSAVQQTEGLESGCFFPVGTTPVTFSATDVDGTVTTCTFNVTVRDVEKPFLELKEFTTALDASQLAKITIEDITTSLPTDNCAIDTIVISRTIFTCSDVGTNEITVTVTDVNGNVSSDTVIITIDGSTSNSGIDPITDAVSCESYTLPQITGENLSGSQRYYTQPNGMGQSFNEADVLVFSDFAAYPVQLFAYDGSSSKECKPQATFQLTIETPSQLQPIGDVLACENFIFPEIDGTNLSGNQAYFTESGGEGIKYETGDEITRDPEQTYPITIFIYDQTSTAACGTEVSFQLDLTACELEVNIEASQNEICDNDISSIALTAVTNPENALGTYSYTWRKNGDPDIVSTSKTYNLIPAFTSLYEVTVVDDGAAATVNTAKASIEIQVNEAPIIAAPYAIEICDTNDSGTGTEVMDLTTLSDNISLDIENTTVTYHDTQEFANSGTSPLPSIYELNMPETLIYARVTNENTGCFETTRITLVLNESPVILLAQNYALCSSNDDNNSPTILLDSGLETLNYDFEWSVDRGNGSESLPSTDASIVANEIGTYTVVATNLDTGCSATATTIVDAATQPTEVSAVAEVSAVLNTHRIQASLTPAPGDNSRFQVRLDDGIWYDMNARAGEFFYNFQGIETGNGVHQVYFRDTIGCFYDQVEVLLVGVPQFFTPNGDGYNDYWNVFGSNQLLEDSKVSIFDRYGKLLSQLTTTSAGWDGSFNGEPLPSTDYWFTLELNDGQVVKGHFAMKR
ncbi:T9SS type B sorting domain-containing protein [Nonlabens marinus]|uniref:HYR domain-containing protein n=1 Tax=Nonlabens marinus S1-08 TaxID=1454201 RepID=W8VS27_9FLAO|nr:T9SS type B sorting domain-containing protein [Nonlabens marinus]BAO55970.1 hypothetical protein NMS_1961 [Nonlabens marinus S1-08]